MSDFLTAKQVIELLKIDRTTLYRMLREDRIKGVKVGSHWRFPSQQIEEIINPDLQNKNQQTDTSSPGEVLPLHCIEPIQDVFSDMSQVASITTDADGLPLSEFSNPCKFCKMILSSEKGREGCITSWKNIDLKKNDSKYFVKCHAGLSYSGANIYMENKRVGKLIAGQFYTDKPLKELEEIRIKKLAIELEIDPIELWNAAQEIKVIDDRIKQFIGKWLEKVAKSFERIAVERKELINRLKNIAKISNI
ncbi:MAG: PocR ligand-binding domain-containing protein [Ignavibacteriaceae bacterium]